MLVRLTSSLLDRMSLITAVITPLKRTVPGRSPSSHTTSPLEASPGVNVGVLEMASVPEGPYV